MKRLLFIMVAVITATLPLCAQDQVTPPAGIEKTTYSFHSFFYEPQASPEEIDEEVQVAISGTDIYMEMVHPFKESLKSWIKGTLDTEAGTATFPVQLMTIYSGMNIYISGSTGNGAEPIVFTYSEQMISNQSQYIQFCDNEAGTEPFCYHLQVTYLIPGEDDPVVTVPDGLQTTSYVFTGNLLKKDEQGGYSSYNGYEEVKRNVKVGFYNNNTEVYIQGLSSQLPEGWVKGSVAEGSFGDKDVTIKKDQCYGKYGFYQLYVAAAYGFNSSSLMDMMMVYDPQKREFSNSGGIYLWLYTKYQNDNVPIEKYVTVKLTPGTLSGIDEVTDARQATAKTRYFDLQGREIVNNDRKLSKGIYLVNGKKVIMK